MTTGARRGFTLIELTIAAALLGLLVGALSQFIGRWEAARRAADERRFALSAIENLMERATVLDFDPAAAEEELQGRLNSPRVEFRISEPDDLGLIAMTASLSWQNAQGERTSPVTLTAWKRSSPDPAPMEASP